MEMSFTDRNKQNKAINRSHIPNFLKDWIKISISKYDWLIVSYWFPAKLGVGCIDNRVEALN